MSDIEAQAEELKNKGNEALKDNHIPAALDFYNRAIELKPTAIYLSNRAFCHIKLENYGSAIEDATTATTLDASYTKALYRRGCAFLGLCKYKEALKDFRDVVRIVPNDAAGRKKLQECEKEFRRIQFEKAIASDDVAHPPSKSIVLTDIAVDSSYDGPHIEESGLTLDFVREMMNSFKNQKKVHQKYIYTILLAAVELLKRMPTVFEVQVEEGSQITVCGDTHGQFYDVLNIFELNGTPSPSNPYLFNGDFVDRGSFSFEVVMTFIAFKVLYPDHFHMIRGNHESRHLNRVYGFEGEVKAKYSEKMFEVFQEVFNWLPLGAVLNRKVFVLHGGLFSKDDVSIADLIRIDRNRDIPEGGLMCEMLWSDPMKESGRKPNRRGVGISFGPDVTKNFLDRNGLELLVRSHEVKDEGFEVDADGRLITIFSAPNYCDQVGNKGAFIRFGADMKPQMTQFTAVPHPNVRPMAYANSLYSM